jgi:hypothetical protein
MFLPASEIRSPEEWRDQLLTVIAAGTLLSTVDVPGMIARMGLADALGPMLDPTLYRDRAKAMDQDRDLLNAALPFWRLLEKINPSTFPAVGPGARCG